MALDFSVTAVPWAAPLPRDFARRARRDPNPSLLIRSQMAAVPALTVPSEMPLNGMFRGLLDGEHAAVQAGTGAARLP
jgi:hypothetical protein